MVPAKQEEHTSVGLSCVCLDRMWIDGMENLALPYKHISNKVK